MKDTIDDRRSRFASAIRYVQERVLLFALAVAFIATAVSFWSLGRMESKLEAADLALYDMNETVATLQLTVFQLQAGQCPANQETSDE